MAKVKAAHHRGHYQVQAKRITDAAKANPSTLCWRCGRTLHQHPRHKTGRPAYWTAGHVNAGERDGTLLPEASVCNYQHGARHGNALRRTTPRRSRTW